MLNSAIEQVISEATEQQVRNALRLLFRPHGTSVFGAAKTVEHEVAALNTLKVLGYVKPDVDEFDLVESLRITKTKARSLLYQAALRSNADLEAIDEALHKALVTTQVLREGSLYMLEVPDPLTMDRLRKRVRASGFLSDGTFSGAIARLPEGALLRLIEELIPDEQKTEIKKQLVKAGLPDKTIAGVLKAMLATAGKKVAGEVGSVAAKTIGEEIGEVLTSGWVALQKFANSKSESKS